MPYHGEADKDRDQDFQKELLDEAVQKFLVNATDEDGNSLYKMDAAAFELAKGTYADDSCSGRFLAQKDGDRDTDIFDALLQLLGIQKEKMSEQVLKNADEETKLITVDPKQHDSTFNRSLQKKFIKAQEKSINKSFNKSFRGKNNQNTQKHW